MMTIKNAAIAASILVSAAAAGYAAARTLRRKPLNKTIELEMPSVTVITTRRLKKSELGLYVTVLLEDLSPLPYNPYTTTLEGEWRYVARVVNALGATCGRAVICGSFDKCTPADAVVAINNILTAVPCSLAPEAQLDLGRQTAA